VLSELLRWHEHWHSLANSAQHCKTNAMLINFPHENHSNSLILGVSFCNTWEIPMCQTTSFSAPHLPIGPAAKHHDMRLSGLDRQGFVLCLSWRQDRQALPEMADLSGNWRPQCQCYPWLVVLTILKHISQWEGLSHILWKIKNVWNHQPDLILRKTWSIPHSPDKPI